MKTIIIILACLTAGLGITHAQSYKIIVNQQNSVGSLTKKEVSNFFLKKTTKWENGTKVVPVDLVEGESIRDDFSKEIHGRSTGAVRSYWQQAVFSGTAVTPIRKNNDQEVIEYVKTHAGAIGYVSSSADLSGDVKVITVN